MFNESSQQFWLSETAHPSRHDFEKLQPNIDAQGICDISVWPAHNPTWHDYSSPTSSQQGQQ